jgi:hypothetical protein
MTTPEELKNRHAYHPPTSDAVIELHEAVRVHTHTLAHWLNDVLPESREKSQALTDVDNAMLHANAAVARHMNG